MDTRNEAVNFTDVDMTSLDGSPVDVETSMTGSRSDIDKNAVVCSQPGCNQRASFAWEIANHRPVCAAHARPMEPCGSAGCRRKASHGFKGSRKLEFCVEHATEGMVNLRTKRCGRQGCFKIPTYGVEGSIHREFCAPHAPSNYVNINSQKCIVKGCIIEASFGIGGTGPRKLCAQHFDKKDSIFPRSNRRLRSGGNVSAENIDVKRTALLHPSDSIEDGTAITLDDPKLCAYEGCTRRTSRGIKGTTKPCLFHEHLEKGIINVEVQKCDSKECTNLAKFGVRGGERRGFCAHHASPDMVRDGGTGDNPDMRITGNVGKPHILEKVTPVDYQSSNVDNDSRRCGSSKRRFDEEGHMSSSSGESESKRPDWSASNLAPKQRAKRPWPRVSILQTETGWSRWNWPALLSSCTT